MARQAPKPTSSRAKSAPAGLALARPGDPYVLPDGKLLQEEIDEYDEDQDLSDNPNPIAVLLPTVATPEAKDFRPEAIRSLRDLGAQPQIFQAVAVVFAYTMMGVNNVEICDATGLNLQELEKIREHRLYGEMFSSMLNEFVNANSSILQSRIAAASHNALGSVLHWASTRKDKIASVGLKAAADLLDRAGARPQDIQQKNNAGMNELRIVVSDETDDKKIKVSHNGNELFDDLVMEIEEIEETDEHGDRYE